MQYSFTTMCCLLIILLISSAGVTTAAPLMTAPSGLSILQIKMTGDEFVMLQNNSGSDITDLSPYWLTTYNNVNPLAHGVASDSQQLPATSLLAGQTLMLNAEPRATCGATVAGDLSVSFSDSSGFVQLSRSSQQAGGSIMQTIGDFASWTCSAAGIIQNVPSSSKNPRAVFYRTSSGGSFAWQQADQDNANSCQLNVVVAGGLGSSSAVTPLTLAATSPPATILGETTVAGEPVAGIPAADVGLQAPQLSELLPNPVGTGTDASDEFIELYNPNAKPFDLSGFSLEAGASRMKSHEFPAGTTLEPNSFRAFAPTDTKLTLSNTSGQVQLVDPLGTTISAVPPYQKAKDGQAWAVAKGNWVFTTQPTPGKANIIVQPVAKKAATKKKKTSSRPGTKPQRLVDQTSATAVGGAIESEAGTVTVHNWVLALVAVAALLYGAYEYRRDIANRLYRLGTKLGFGRASRSQPERARSD